MVKMYRMLISLRYPLQAQSGCRYGKGEGHRSAAFDSLRPCLGTCTTGRNRKATASLGCFTRKVSLLFRYLHHPLPFNWVQALLPVAERVNGQRRSGN